MSISKLRILSETTVNDYPEQSLQAFINEAISEFDIIKEKSEHLINACALHGIGDLEEVAVLHDALKAVEK